MIATLSAPAFAARNIGEICPSQNRVIDPRSVSSWDALIESFSGATVFHGTGWCSSICDTYGFRPFYLASYHQDRIVQCLPIIEVNSWLTGRRGISLPFTDECAPIATDDLRQTSSDRELFSAAKALGRERRWKYLEIRSNPEGKTDASVGFYTHVLHLPCDESEILGKFDPKLRNKLRQAERSHLTFEIHSTLEAVKEFYRLHCVTRQKHGVPPQPFRFFENISRALIQCSQGFVALVKKGAQPIASAIFLHAGSKGHYKFSASDPQFEDCRPNDFLMWRSIQHCVQVGLRSLDFGRTSLDNSGLRSYKRKWGTVEHILSYQKWNIKEERFVADTDRSAGPVNKVFRFCPPWLNRVWGALLYPHIA